MEKGQFFLWSQNYKGNHLNKNIKKENFKKDLMNLIETNHQINIISDHPVSSNKSFKSHLNTKRFNMFLTLKQLCKSRWFCFSVCYNGEANV